MIADQGGIPYEPFYTPVLKHVSNLMANLSTKYDTHFQFALGDNFYDDGVLSVNDSRFKDTFENVFNHSNLVNTPWFFCLGIKCLIIFKFLKTQIKVIMIMERKQIQKPKLITHTSQKDGFCQVSYTI